MKTFHCSHLAIYTYEYKKTNDKIGDAWILKIGCCLVGFTCCRGDYFPGMLFSDGSITLQLLKALPGIR